MPKVNTACVALPHCLTHPHVFGVVGQGLQAFDDGVLVFLPLPFAEHNLQKVPRPANEGHIEQFPFCQDFELWREGEQLVHHGHEVPTGSTLQAASALAVIGRH